VAGGDTFRRETWNTARRWCSTAGLRVTFAIDGCDWRGMKLATGAAKQFSRPARGDSLARPAEEFERPFCKSLRNVK